MWPVACLARRSSRNTSSPRRLSGRSPMRSKSRKRPCQRRLNRMCHRLLTQRCCERIRWPAGSNRPWGWRARRIAGFEPVPLHWRRLPIAFQKTVVNPKVDARAICRICCLPPIVPVIGRINRFLPSAFTSLFLGPTRSIPHWSQKGREAWTSAANSICPEAETSVSTRSTSAVSAARNTTRYGGRKRRKVRSSRPEISATEAMTKRAPISASSASTPSSGGTMPIWITTRRTGLKNIVASRD